MADSKSRLATEIRQTRPFRTPNAEVALAVMRTAAVLRRRYARAIEPHGLSLPQYNVLRILRGSGADGLPTLAIRERMVEEAAGITRLVDKLAEQGLVERLRGGPDRRQVICRITPQGLSLLAVLDPIVDAADGDVLAMLGPDDVAALGDLLDRIRAGHDDLRVRPESDSSESLCE